NSVSLMSTMAGSWLLKDFSAVYLTIGAINELSTLTGYGALIRKSGHPVLKDLLSRIIKDERKHYAFYFNSAKEWLSGNARAQKIDRWMLDNEEWAVKPPKHSSVGELTTRRIPQAEEAVAP